jgi:hypothetical protein
VSVKSCRHPRLGAPCWDGGAVRHGADASHELRTPLTSVRGLAEFSLQQGEAAAREELIRLMTRIQQEAYGWDCWSRICCSPS